jgi:hypothetical protein
MRISKKNATLIRRGVVVAKLHMSTIENMLAGRVPTHMLPLVEDALRQTMPRHPLSIRAYIRAMEQRTAYYKRNSKDMIPGAPAFSAPPEPPKTQTNKSGGIPIADGFHD